MEGIDRLKMRDQIDMARSNNNRGSDVYGVLSESNGDS